MNNLLFQAFGDFLANSGEPNKKVAIPIESDPIAPTDLPAWTQVRGVSRSGSLRSSSRRRPGSRKSLKPLDSGLRRNDERVGFSLNLAPFESDPIATVWQSRPRAVQTGSCQFCQTWEFVPWLSDTSNYKSRRLGGFFYLARRNWQGNRQRPEKEDYSLNEIYITT
jgi:hypothetical protein